MKHENQAAEAVITTKALSDIISVHPVCVISCRSLMLVAIVVIYMVSNVPRLLLNLVEYLNQVCGDNIKLFSL